MNELLTVKELASKLRRTPRYVYAMTRCGFSMPGGTATIEEARAFLVLVPCPRSHRVLKGRIRSAKG